MKNDDNQPQEQENTGKDKEISASSITEKEAKEQEGDMGGATNLSLDQLKKEGGTAGTPNDDVANDDQRKK